MYVRTCARAHWMTAKVGDVPLIGLIVPPSDFASP
jgi:hypothetical protein